MGASGTAAAREDYTTVFPPDPLTGHVEEIFRGLSSKRAAALVNSDGQHIALPPEVADALVHVAAALVRGEAVTIAPVHTELTTQEAADLLGISRPTLIKLLEDGEIPYTRPRRHRRIKLADVDAYRRRQAVQRRQALEEMSNLAERLGQSEEDPGAAPSRH